MNLHDLSNCADHVQNKSQLIATASTLELNMEFDSINEAEALMDLLFMGEIVHVDTIQSTANGGCILQFQSNECYNFLIRIAPYIIDPNHQIHQVLHQFKGTYYKEYVSSSSEDASDGELLPECNCGQNHPFDVKCLNGNTRIEPVVKSCGNCGSTTPPNGKLKICTKCRAVRYCNVVCQRTHWVKGKHHKHCNAK